MPYFVDRLSQVRLPVGITADTRLRSCQRGAIHAIAAHFTARTSDPGVVVMPTGSGKTAIITLTPFLLEARRALVVTPSRLVRSQIVSEFQSLADLRALGVIDDDVALPTVKEVGRRLSSADAWTALENVDVVVGTPNTVSPAVQGVAAPPHNFFDLLLVDEAHHSPSKTWQALLDAFPSARRVLFTATPFRRDGREIVGDLIYQYAVAQAYEDGIFGELNYVPVEPARGQDHDVALALETERVFNADQGRELRHVVMVRTDTKKRARELLDLYRANTQLRLELIDSDKKFREAQATIARLRNGELDGVVCVDMMSEGFDFPNLKIAALHQPHRSLAVTLQFIGRFARLNGPQLGGATFLAIPSEIEIEAVKLFRRGRVWTQLVPHLLDRRVAQEAAVRFSLDTFSPRETTDDQIHDVSLYALRPYHHVKVFAVSGAVNLDAEVQLPRPYQVKYRQVSEELGASVFIAIEYTKPRWTSSDLFMGKEFELFVVYYHEPTQHLFICASEKTERLYESIVRQFAPEGARKLPQTVVKKALAGLERVQVLNLGLRSRVFSKNVVSYQTRTGPLAHHSVKRSDALYFHPGHLFGKAQHDGNDVTIGISTLSKIWSNTASHIPELIAWCELLAQRIVGDATALTGSDFDFLTTGEVVAEIPPLVIAADWDHHDYERPPVIAYTSADGAEQRCQLLDCDLVVDRDGSGRDCIRFTVAAAMGEWPLEFWIDREPQFCESGQSALEAIVEVDDTQLRLVDHLNHHPLVFYFADRSSLQGQELFRGPDETPWQPFNADLIEVVDWDRLGVAIEVEFEDADHVLPDGTVSIHGYVEQRLLQDNYDIIFYDHSNGEIADFLAIRREADHLRFEVYHCKKSASARGGARVQDIDEVAAQVVRSLTLLMSRDGIERHVRHRLTLTVPRFVKGSMDDLVDLFERCQGMRCDYGVVAVQPGLSKRQFNQDLGVTLAAAHDFAKGADYEALRVLGSA